jgi:hypothetical protein
MAKKKSKKEVEVHLAQMFDTQLLEEHPKNVNKQNRHTQKELKDSILEEGFDETLIVSPRDDGEAGYWVVSGNHRFRAGKALGMQEFPCVLRDDWDAIKQQVQLLRRNMVRGDISKSDFTMAVNRIENDSNLELGIIQEMLGFENPDKFAHVYQEEREKDEKVVAGVVASPQVKVLDDVGPAVSHILEEHGDTVPYSYIIFPMGGKNHLYVQTSPTLKKVLETICEKCVHEGLDINVALGGLLSIGMAHTNFKKMDTKTEEIKEAGDTEGDSDL